MAASWRDLSTPLNQSSTPAPIASQSAPSVPKSGGWRDLSSPLNQEPSAPAAASSSSSVASSDQPIDSATGQPWKPSGNAFIDFLTMPRAKTEDPIAAAMDVGMSAFDTGTFGYGPKYVGGQDAARQAHENMGLMDYPVSALAYAAGPGKILGPLARMGTGALVPAAAPTAGFLARAAPSIAAGATEGAAAGGLGAAGHDGGAGDVALGAGLGALSGAAGGALGGSGPKPKAPEVGTAAGTDATGVPRAPTGMYAAKEAAYAPLDSLYFDTHGDAIDRAQTAIRQVRDPQGKGAPLGIPSDVNSILTDTNGLANPEVTGRTIQQASRDLRATGDWTGHRYAAALDNTLRYDTPSAGGGAGEGWNAKQAGDLWHGRINDLERLSADTPSGAPGPTPSAVQQTKARYEPLPNAQPGPEYQSLTDLQNAMKPSFNWWHARHVIGPLLGGAVGGVEDALNPDQHRNPWLNVGTRAVEGGLLFSALPAAARGRPGAALNAARYAIGTGQPISTPTGRLGDMLVNLLYGQAAGNRSPY